jgi:Protein of unknown function (DUF3237)
MKPELQLLFEAHGALEAPLVVGETPTGLKRVVPILGGTFNGPQISGTIVPGGADWQYVRADDVTVVEATPVLTAPAGRYDWLNRHLFVCSGARFATAITLWVYQIL